MLVSPVPFPRILMQVICCPSFACCGIAGLCDHHFGSGCRRYHDCAHEPHVHGAF